MTRDERIQAALDACYPDASRPSHGQLSRALDAALADVGGLDGLDGLLIARGVWLAQVDDERDALRADRDRLREALRSRVGVVTRDAMAGLFDDRDGRIDAGERAYYRHAALRQGESRKALAAALDAALADLGGLDGLEGFALRFDAQRSALEAVEADRDRLREAIREVVIEGEKWPTSGAAPGSPLARLKDALRESEAGS